jgi:hypothetical protein
LAARQAWVGCGVASPLAARWIVDDYHREAMSSSFCAERMNGTYGEGL